MWGLILTLWGSLAHAECRFDPGPVDASLSTHASSAGVVILEIRLTDQDHPPDALLKVLEDRGVSATILTTAAWAEKHSATLVAAAESGHEIGYWVSLREDLQLRGDMSTPPGLGVWVKSLRRGKKTVRRASGQPVRTIGIQTLPNIGEIAIEGLGFRAILPAERTIEDQPRRSASLHSAAGRARVLGEGPYPDGCGAVLPAWTPGALDRATRVAAAGPWVRIALPPNPSAAPLLSRWMDEVVLPHKWTVLTASAAARRAKPGLGKPARAMSAASPAVVSRTVDAKTWRAAAEALAAATTLPRTFPGGLNPTEAFFVLTQRLTLAGEPTDIALVPLQGPLETARTGLGTAVVTLDKDVVRQAARDLAPGLTGHIPSLISVGNRSLTAAEFLRAMALVILDRPVQVRAVSDPDPFAPGGGWGVSGSL